jgi:deazaflavin-dependent oxidoreductase (nitroreductase family)
MLTDQIRAALARPQVIDMTTTGRKSGEPRRIEIVYHVFDGRIYISGMPRAGKTRAWIHNLEADPRLVVHLKKDVVADLPATARVITDPAERRAILVQVARVWNQHLEAMVAHSPLIEVSIDGYEVGRAA